MSKKIEWLKRGMTANNGLHMQEVCDQIADATTAINNSLQKPTTAPSATQIVTVDNTNTQTMLNIGDGLSVENGSLKASGGASGKLYYKNIELIFEEDFVELEGIRKITIYFYESNDTIYDSNNINTLCEKIPFAICSIKADSPQPGALVWIFGCMPSSVGFDFDCLRDGGEVVKRIILFNEIDDTKIKLFCDYVEV